MSRLDRATAMYPVAVLVVALALPARADTQRYAVVIGNNTGGADDQPLRYAENDAQRFAELLRGIGGVARENQHVLRGDSADQVRNTILAMNARIRASTGSDAGTVLFIYYSGHGSADALHLDGTQLPLRALEALVRGSPATVRVLVIDSCRSGSVTRVKGGTPAPPLALSVTSSIGEGMIVLTASAQSEDAQESDQLGGSFFTHYLLTGLRGAADHNGDQVVTVSEAFSYTRDQTIMASSRTIVGPQHPTFHYDHRGHTELALTDLRDLTSHGKLTVPAGASWLIMHTGPAASSRTVVGEITRDARRRTLSLRAGMYAVRAHTHDAVLEGVVTVAVGRNLEVDASTLERTTYTALMRAGRSSMKAAQLLRATGLQRNAGRAANMVHAARPPLYRRWWPYAAATGVVSGATAYFAWSAYSAVQELKVDYSEQLLERCKRHIAFTNIGIGVTAAFAVTTGWMYVTRPRHQASAHAVAVPMQGGGALLWSGTF